MPEIDNLEEIKKIFKSKVGFHNKDDFYYLQILQRKKENPELGSNSRVIKNYYLTSLSYLESHYHEIKELCKHFNARASLRLNRRNFEKVAYKAMVNTANSMSNKEFSFIKKSYDRAVGQGNSEPKDSKTWILDWDGHFSFLKQQEITKIIAKAEPIGDKIVGLIPSKSGMHLIVKPFDSRDFKLQFPDVEIHKDNPTNLYIP